MTNLSLLRCGQWGVTREKLGARGKANDVVGESETMAKGGKPNRVEMYRFHQLMSVYGWCYPQNQHANRTYAEKSDFSRSRSNIKHLQTNEPKPSQICQKQANYPREKPLPPSRNTTISTTRHADQSDGPPSISENAMAQTPKWNCHRYPP